MVLEIEERVIEILGYKGAGHLARKWRKKTTAKHKRTVVLDHFEIIYLIESLKMTREDLQDWLVEGEVNRQEFKRDTKRIDVLIGKFKLAVNNHER